MDRQTYKRDRQTDIKTDGQTNRRTDGQMNRWTYGQQIVMQTDRQITDR